MEHIWTIENWEKNINLHEQGHRTSLRIRFDKDIDSEAGIVIKDGKYKRQYLWDELPVKRINANCVNLGRGINKYHECIVFSKSRFLRPRFLNPVYIKMLFNRSVFCIYLTNGDEESKNLIDLHIIFSGCNRKRYNYGKIKGMACRIIRERTVKGYIKTWMRIKL